MRWIALALLAVSCATPRTEETPHCEEPREQTITESEVKIDHGKAELRWWENYINMWGGVW